MAETPYGLGAATMQRFGLLSRLEAGLLELPAAKNLQRHLRDEAHGQSSLSFYAVLTVWLMLVYGCFGVITEHSWLGSLIVGLSVVAIVLTLFVILDMNTPFTGLVVVSDAPLREALRTVLAE